VIHVLMDAQQRGARVFLLGNGGSAATASHMANDLNKLTIVDGQPRFKAIALTDNVPLMTAWGNDTAYENIFVEQMLNFLEPGDVVVGISTSGNSGNVVRALEVAREYGAITVGFIGRDGGQLRHVADHCVFVPSDHIGQQEDVHMVLDHVIANTLRDLIVAEQLWKNGNKEIGEKVGAVFLDRDGVINENRSDYVKCWEEFEFLPGVFDPLRFLAQNHKVIVVVSNQSAIGRGLVPGEVVEGIHRRMRIEIQRRGGRIDGVFYCPHRPDDNCGCRKPRPGLLLRAADELNLDLAGSYFVGDAVSDVEAALAAGCAPIFVLTGRGREQRPLLHENGYNSVPVVRDLAEAVSLLPNGRRWARG